MLSENVQVRTTNSKQFEKVPVRSNMIGELPKCSAELPKMFRAGRRNFRSTAKLVKLAGSFGEVLISFLEIRGSKKLGEFAESSKKLDFLGIVLT